MENYFLVERFDEVKIPIMKKTQSIRFIFNAYSSNASPSLKEMKGKQTKGINFMKLFFTIADLPQTNKLECLSLAGLYNSFKSIRVRLEPTQVKRLSVSQSSGFTH